MSQHPIFSRWYDFVTAFVERSGYGQLRERILRPARGRLLAIGLGPGYDLLHLPPAVTEVVGVDPDAVMRRIAARRAAEHGIEVQLVDAGGERLPFEDANFDTVLCSLVLCTVDDPQAVLSEARRVLRPDGELLVLEHVRAEDGSSLARWQDRLARPWSFFGGGCRPNCRTRSVFESAGFDTTGLAESRVDDLPPLIRPHLHGRARPRPVPAR